MAYAACIESHPQPGDGRQRVLSVEFETSVGDRWRAIGGGATLEEAIAFASEAVPSGRHFRVVRIEELYGE